MSTIADLNTLSQIKAVNITILNNLKNGHAALLSTWQNSIDLIWDSQDPQAILDDMGTSAGDLFDKSTAVADFLHLLSPGCCNSASAKVQAHTINNDGTVTID